MGGFLIDMKDKKCLDVHFQYRRIDVKRVLIILTVTIGFTTDPGTTFAFIGLIFSFDSLIREIKAYRR